MRRALACLEGTAGRVCDGLLIDVNQRIPGVTHAHWPIVGGDGKHLAIAAASVLAKELRDSLMVALDGAYPGYGFGALGLSCHSIQ